MRGSGKDALRACNGTRFPTESWLTMAVPNGANASHGDAAKVRDEWLHILADLMGRVNAWAVELGWSTRQIEKRMHDAEIGDYDAPALLLQFETDRVLVDPIGRSAPGADGIVDLYLMPAYDDIATLLLRDGVWQFHYLLPGAPSVGSIQDAAAYPLSKQTLADILLEMRKNAKQAV